MKTVITGHTYGIGRACYEHFDFDRVVEAIKGADLFINNAYANHSQVKLFHAVKNYVGKIVCMGSVARLYPNVVTSSYAANKQELYDTVRVHNLTPGTIPALHLDISFLEKDSLMGNNTIQSDNFITSREVIEIIEIWLIKPNFTNIEFSWKFSDIVKQKLEGTRQV